MLHESVAMTDIDVDHWRHLQSLLLESAKARTRIVVIHEQGEVLSVAHSAGEAVRDAPREIEGPTDVARALHEANPDVDLVVVFERDAVDEHFAAMGASWNPDEDLDAWVRRLYGSLDRDDEGIRRGARARAGGLECSVRRPRRRRGLGDAHRRVRHRAPRHPDHDRRPLRPALGQPPGGPRRSRLPGS